MYKVIKYPKHQMVKSRKRYQNGECTYQGVHELERPEFSKNAGI